MDSVKLVSICVMVLVTHNLLQQTPHPEPDVVTEEHNRKEKVLKKDSVLLVKLKTIQGGYAWEPPSFNKKVLVLEKEYEEKLPPEFTKDGKPLLGRGSLSVFQFKAKELGKSAIELQCVRPFDKEKKPASTFTLQVHVK